MILYISKSLKNGKYFCSKDPFGKFEADLLEIDARDMPTFFSESEILRPKSEFPWNNFFMHVPEEIKMIKVVFNGY